MAALRSRGARWATWQLVRSLVPLWLREMERSLFVTRSWIQWLAAASSLGVGLLQAWDSDVHVAPPAIGALVLLAIANAAANHELSGYVSATR